MDEIDYKARFKTAAYTAKWAVTMTKVRIRQAVAHAPFPHWHILTFTGADGRESRGVVDLIAIRKDHRSQPAPLRRGDTFQIVLIQVKGGYAASPTTSDAERLRAVCKLHHADDVLLASWKKGAAARFYKLRSASKGGQQEWIEVEDLQTVFC